VLRTLDDVADGVRVRVCGHDERARVRLQHGHAVVPDAAEELRRRVVERRERADGPVLAPRRAAEAAPVEHVRPPAVLMLLLLSLLVPRRCECSGEEEGAEEEDEEERSPRSASGARHCVRQVEVTLLSCCVELGSACRRRWRLFVAAFGPGYVARGRGYVEGGCVA
jgi:acetoin utilization deacetylase AcuC-like enzyme